ncbi:MAG: SAM-dependent chlorinase/fluorinase [Steroidobacteraceae bacterium]
MAEFQPSGVITLTTDFGLADPFVGVMKGCILSRFPAARIVDLTHEVPAHRPGVAGFWLSRCFEYFPSGTVHVAVVDPGVGTDRGILCMAARGHLLLAPDNGLLTLCHARHPRAEVVRLAAPRLAELGIHRVSSTFHGRDIFAPVAADLAAGRYLPATLGVRVQSLASAVTPASADDSELGSRPGAVNGSVVTVDHFGNLITDIDAAQLHSFENPRVHIAGKTLRLRRTYGDVRPGELLALINSFEVLEIAQAEGNAAAALAVGPEARVTVDEGAEHLLGGANPL